MTAGTGGAAAAAAESDALSALRPQPTGAEKLTGCEKAERSIGTPAKAGMSPATETATETGTGAAATGETGPETGMSGLVGTGALSRGMAGVAERGQDPKTGTTGADLMMTGRTQISTGLAAGPPARKQTGRKQHLLMWQVALCQLTLAERSDIQCCCDNCFSCCIFLVSLSVGYTHSPCPTQIRLYCDICLLMRS